MRENTIRLIKENKLIAIVRGVPLNSILKTAEALFEGGVRLIEVTFDAANREKNCDTAEAIRLLKNEFGDKLHVGAGTVLYAEQLEMARDAGAEYIISPDCNPEIIKLTRQFGLVSIPGAMTPTEIQEAHLAGADFVKVFPVSELGASYVKSVRAPLSHIPLLVVGGIVPENIPEYMSAGASGVGVGGKIVDLKKIADGKFNELTEIAKRYVAACNA